jgi:hypothetical protein
MSSLKQGIESEVILFFEKPPRLGTTQENQAPEELYVKKNSGTEEFYVQKKEAISASFA